MGIAVSCGDCEPSRLESEALALPQPVTRTVITLPPGQQLAGLDNGPAVALSPDGTHLAYVARQGGIQQIYLRAMDSLEAKPIPGTEGAANPFFSPDGQWLGFFAGGKLKKVSVSGGAALTLGDAAYSFGASWGSQGMIAFAPAAVGVLQQVSGRGRHPADADSSRERRESATGGRSSCPAARQCCLLPEQLELIGPTRRLPSSRSERANGGT